MENQKTESFSIEAGEAGTRLDRVCAARLNTLSRNQIQSLNREGAITIGGRRRPDSYAVREGERVEIVLPEKNGGEIPRGEDIPLPVVFEDDYVIVVNKPAGLVVHPAHGNWSGTLVNALIGRGTRLPAMRGSHRPGIVHRLDKDTSGLMVVAKTDEAFLELTKTIKNGDLHKEYHGIVVGNLGKPRLTVDLPIGRHPTKRQRMAVTPGAGKEALTELFVVDSYEHFDYIRVTTFTGRTHQIRVHLSHLAHPLLGDAVYGGRKKRGKSSSPQHRATFEKLKKILSRHALHASKLRFQHPVTNLEMVFSSALPHDMQNALEVIYREDRIKEV